MLFIVEISVKFIIGFYEKSGVELYTKMRYHKHPSIFPEDEAVMGVRGVEKQKRKNKLKTPQSTWEVFDCLYLVDLEDIISSHWSELRYIFKDSKQYKSQELPSYGTKEHLMTKLRT